MPVVGVALRIFGQQRRPNPELTRQALSQGIEGAGADITIDHANRRQRDAGQGLFVITAHEVILLHVCQSTRARTIRTNPDIQSG